MEKTLESPLHCKEIQLVHSEGDQPWDCFGRNDAKAETPVLWPPHVKSWLIGKDWCWEGLGAGEEGNNRGWDGWMASLTDGRESGWTLGVGDGQGCLECCDSWGRKKSDTTEWLNWTELMIICMFQWHSPKSSHSSPLPQSPKYCSILQYTNAYIRNFKRWWW